ncbi:hotdog family protein [Erwinia sp. B116]|uniref:ApeP family dehydratase n=1 Tax=Erwinia sp. B116 TaxID=1561024 RepID=UPI000C7936DA|nr:hotdog family protein [Erwinia sp. B116]PLV62101.1 3-hydroxy-fatty acyl-ACP dehydratase [Erwinia sp. B116]
MTDYLPAARYLPHSAPMVLIDRVIAVTEETAHCRVQVSACSVLAPFLNAAGALPAWYGIEILAQTIGVWSGWHAQRRDDAAPQIGMLLGGRGYRTTLAAFPADCWLNVHVTLLMRDEKMGSFEGQICIDDACVASGRLNTYQPDNLELQKIIEQGNNG